MALLLTIGAACTGEIGASVTHEKSPNATSAVGPLHADIEDEAIYQVRGAVDKECRVTFGDSISNPSDQSVTITGAQFGNVKGVKVLGIVKLPEGSLGVGNPPGFPPKKPKALRKVWPQVEELVGSTLRPGEATWMAFGIQLEPGIPEGTVSALSIDYEAGGVRYRATDQDTFTAVDYPRATCPA